MKYIIEVEDVPFSKARFDTDNAQNINLYRAKGFDSLVFDQFGLDKLTPLDIDKELEESYIKGLHVGSIDTRRRTEEAYQRGLDDVWKAITKIAKMPDVERGKVFGACWISDILNNFSASEIINILDGYKPERDEIKVGDEMEVCDDPSVKMIVLNVQSDTISGFNCCGTFSCRQKCEWRKTGRHFPQVEELIEAMKEGAE